MTQSNRETLEAREKADEQSIPPKSRPLVLEMVTLLAATSVNRGRSLGTTWCMSRGVHTLLLRSDATLEDAVDQPNRWSINLQMSPRMRSECCWTTILRSLKSYCHLRIQAAFQNVTEPNSDVRLGGTREYAYHPNHEELSRCIGNDNRFVCLSCGNQFVVRDAALVAVVMI